MHKYEKLWAWLLRKTGRSSTAMPQAATNVVAFRVRQHTENGRCRKMPPGTTNVVPFRARQHI